MPFLSNIKRKSIKEIVAAKTKQLEKQLKDKEATERKNKNQYPPLIATLLKRLKRIDPWSGIASLDLHDSVLVSYFKLKQRDISEVRIAVTPNHAWIEFNYDDKWWIFDPLAVKDLSLGDPVKQRLDAKEEKYKSLARYFDKIDEYIEKYDNKISLSKDEAKIEAMKDEGLSSVLKIKYH
jgi:hypothetical protein